LVAVFVSVPDHQAGKPLSIREALSRLEMFIDIPGFDEIITAGGSIPPDAGCWVWLRAGLKSLCVSAHVRSPEEKCFFKIPPEYWEERDSLDSPHVLFLGMADAVGYAPSIVGQPMVIWEEELADLLKVAGDMVAALHKVKAQSGEPTDAAKSESQEIGDPFDRSSPWSEISAWYLRYIADAPEEGYTREEDERAGRALGIGRDRMRELRREYKPAHWSDGGRPPQKTRRN